MAASATKLNEVPFGNGQTNRRMEYGYITYDSDATVEVNTSLAVIENSSFTDVGVSGGAADLPSIDETVSNGVVTVSAGAITVDTASSNSRTFHYQLIGY